MALEREKNRLVLEKCRTIIETLLQDEDNKYCVDCDAKSPRWASWNIGIFLCMNCAGIHRNLGVHISKVKSVSLDSWTPQQVACIQQMGNSRARAVYEANLQDNFCRPRSNPHLEQFIRAKYEAKKYIAREWVPPALPNPTWDLDIEKQLKKKREKKSVSGSVEFPATVKSSTCKSGGVSPKPLPKAPGGRNSSSPNQIKRVSGNCSSADKENLSSGTIDLLGLDTPVPTTTNGVAEGDTDVFGDFLTAPTVTNASTTPSSVSLEPNKDTTAPTTTTQTDESNFFNQKIPDLSGAEKLSKDSILALYNQTPGHGTQQQSQPQASVYGGGGMFANPAGMPMMATPQPNLGLMSQPQNMMLFQQTSTSGGPGVGGMQTSLYPQGMPMMTGSMFSAIPPGLPGRIQLSAANPFAQMQAQMGTMNLGGMVGPQPQQLQVANPLLKTGSNLGTTNPPLQSTTTLSTNLWQ